LIIDFFYRIQHSIILHLKCGQFRIFAVQDFFKQYGLIAIINDLELVQRLSKLPNGCVTNVMSKLITLILLLNM